ncbi:MAG TPA: DUF418 domain-containing protein [Chitinophagaceae bacterium]|nr:DUF418 domain-containing protein [Chitinophagaceae bacterium]
METFQPIQKTDRVRVVDALRGFALFAILLANIPIAENADVIYKARTFILGSPTTDKLLDGIFHLVIDKKFVAIFSVLFGFGFYVQLKRAEERGIAFRKYFMVRMALLLAIACIHAYFLWFGDIIRDYAICGMLVLLMCKWSPKKLLVTGLLFAVLGTAIVFILNGVIGVSYSFDTSIVSEHPLTTSYWHYLQINSRIDPFRNFIQDSPITLVFAFGCMLIGFALAKSGFFHQPERFIKTTNRLIGLGLPLGLICSYLFWMISIGKLELTPALIWLPVVIVAGLFLQSLFYISAFVKLYSYNPFKKLVLPFEFVGRMALSNYILQSIFYLLIFFHCTNGLNLYGKLTLTETYLTAVALFGVQVIFSKWWLKKHSQGPVEFLWKNMVYRFFTTSAGQKQVSASPVL